MGIFSFVIASNQDTNDCIIILSQAKRKCKKSNIQKEEERLRHNAQKVWHQICRTYLFVQIIAEALQEIADRPKSIDSVWKPWYKETVENKRLQKRSRSKRAMDHGMHDADKKTETLN